MRRLKTVLIVAAVIVVFVAAGAIQTLACSAVYIGKDVSKDGSTIIARSEDQGQGIVNKRWQVVPAEVGAGRELVVYGEGSRFELPESTFKYTMVQDYEGAWGDYAGSCVNENGVAITATVTTSTSRTVRNLDPLTYGVGAEEAMMANYIAAVAENARDGIEKLGAIIKERGAAETNTIMVVDQNEAWYMEMYTGHHWVAVKMPEDVVSVFGNCFMLGTEYDETSTDPDTGTFMCSDGFWDFVAELDAANLSVYETVNGSPKLHLAKTFTQSSLSAGNQTRNWAGEHFFAPATYVAYDADEWYPLFFTPEADVSPMDVLALYRYRFEDVPALAGARSLATEMSSQVHMLQVFDDMPKECAVLQWICLGNSEHGMFIPSWSGITDVHSAYKVSQVMRYDPDGAWWKTKRVATTAEQNRSFLGENTMALLASYETMLYDQLLATKDDINTRYGDRAAGDRYVTQMATETAGNFFDQSDRIYEDLTYHMMFYSAATTKIANPRINLSDVAKTCNYSLTRANGVYTLTVDTVKYTFTIGEASYKKNDGGALAYNVDILPNALIGGDLYVPVSFILDEGLIELSTHYAAKGMLS